MNKREEIRLRRQRQKRRKQLTTVMVISGFAFIAAAFVIFANFRPVGEIVQITPVAYLQADGNAIGDPNAPVLVEVFEDFQCPACKDYTQRIETLIISTYVASGEVYYVFRQFPFMDDRAVTNESQNAAIASLCAGEQDEFWNYHDMLYANFRGQNSGGFSVRRLNAFAEILGLNVDEFNACLESGRYQEQINLDFQDGRGRGVTGTPSVFVNGEQITPGFVPSFEAISEAVEAALLESGS